MTPTTLTLIGIIVGPPMLGLMVLGSVVVYRVIQLARGSSSSMQPTLPQPVEVVKFEKPKTKRRTK